MRRWTKRQWVADRGTDLRLFIFGCRVGRRPFTTTVLRNETGRPKLKSESIFFRFPEEHRVRVCGETNVEVPPDRVCITQARAGNIPDGESSKL